jgi:hypothetical protein
LADLQTAPGCPDPGRARPWRPLPVVDPVAGKKRSSRFDRAPAITTLTRRTWSATQSSAELMVLSSGGGRTTTSAGPDLHSVRHLPSHGFAAGNACRNALARKLPLKRSA